MDCEKALCGTRRFEPTYLALLLTSLFIRSLTATIGVAVFAVNDIGHYLTHCGCVTLEFVDDHAVRRAALCLESLFQESLRRVYVLPFLHEDIDSVTVLVDSTPQLATLTLDGPDINFVQKADVAGTAIAFS